MRIWDLPPRLLCRQHLLGEHRELHALWSVITSGKQGYSRHPETRRWVGALKGLYARHERLVKEMQRRGYNHQSPLPAEQAIGKARPGGFIDTPAAQRRILKNKGCDCRV